MPAPIIMIAEDKIECPNCHHSVDSREGHKAPRPGDYSVCMLCETISRFDDRMVLQQLSEAEQWKLALEDPDCWSAIQNTINAIRQIKSHVIR